MQGKLRGLKRSSRRAAWNARAPCYCTMQGVLEKKTAGSKWVNVQCVLEGRNLASGEAPMAVLEVTDIENRVREPGRRALHVFVCC